MALGDAGIEGIRLDRSHLVLAAHRQVVDPVCQDGAHTGLILGAARIARSVERGIEQLIDQVDRGGVLRGGFHPSTFSRMLITTVQSPAKTSAPPARVTTGCRSTMRSVSSM